MSPRIFAALPLPEPVCWHFRKRGSCAMGDACRFAHAGTTAEEAGASARRCAPELLLYWTNRMPRNTAEYSLLAATLEAHGFRRALTPEEEARSVLLWCGTSTVPPRLKLDASPLPQHCVVNRLGCGAFLTHKDQLIMSLRRARQMSLAPLTFLLPADLPQLLSKVSLLSGTRRQKNDERETWILKPYSAGCGRGIFVTQDVAAQVRSGEKWIVSRYVTRPLLVEGKKLDLRLFVLVLAETPTALQGRRKRKAYISRHGLVRFAAKDFGLCDLQTGRQEEKEDGGAKAHASVVSSNKGAGMSGMWDPMVHLTYINSKNKKLHRQQRSKQWTVQQLLDWLAQHPHYGQRRAHELWRAIQQLALRTVECLPPPPSLQQSRAAHALAQTSGAVVREGGREGERGQGERSSLSDVKEERKGAFELFGFDVLPDEALRPWLLEVSLVCLPIHHHGAYSHTHPHAQIRSETYTRTEVFSWTRIPYAYGSFSTLMRDMGKDLRRGLWLVPLS